MLSYRLQVYNRTNHNNTLPCLLPVGATRRVRPLLATLDTERSRDHAAPLWLFRRSPGLSQIQCLAGTVWREEKRDTRGYAYAVRHGLLQLRWHHQVLS